MPDLFSPLRVGEIYLATRMFMAPV